MALRPRNIALEGFADDFIDPLVIAVVGFVDAGSVVSVSIACESPAQTEDIEAHVVAPAVLAGGGYWRRSPAIVVPSPPRVLHAYLSDESPAQLDAVCVVVSDPAIDVDTASKAPRKKVTRKRISLRAPPLARVSSSIVSESPSQGGCAVAHCLIDASSASESPRQTDNPSLFAYRIDSRSASRLSWRRKDPPMWYRERPCRPTDR